MPNEENSYRSLYLQLNSITKLIIKENLDYKTTLFDSKL